MMSGDSSTTASFEAPADGSTPSLFASALADDPTNLGLASQTVSSQAVPSRASEPVAASFQELDISAGAASSMPAARFDAGVTFESAAHASSAAASPDLAVSVANPQKVGEGMSAYFTYEVTTKTSLPQYAFGQFSVTRRFRDFDWLHAQLVAKFPGAIVPPLPEKHSAQVATLKVTAVSQSPAWLEERRVALQRFLHSLVAHPMLHTAADLQAFLEKPDDALEAWKELAKQHKGGLVAGLVPMPTMPAMPTSTSQLVSDVKAGLYSGYNKSVSLFGGETSTTFTPVLDSPCQQMTNYATALQTQVGAVHKTSKAYIDKQKALSASYTNFGLALTQLSTCEAPINESLSRGISHMGLCVGRLSATYAEQAESETSVFEEPMREYTRLLSSVKAAVGARDSSLRAFNAASSSLAAKKERLEKLKGAGGRDDKISVLTREVAEAEEAVNLGKSEYETVAARVDAEMARFQAEKLVDFKKYVVDFIKLQIDYSQRVQQAWSELLPRLDEMDSTSPSATQPAGPSSEATRLPPREID